jgi:hypothetical protein
MLDILAAPDFGDETGLGYFKPNNLASREI